jgi:polysaccharide pyruvyl transferase WcaK-like protein
LFGILGSGNWGNDGTLEVVVDEITSRFPGVELRFMAMGPDVLRERYGAPAIHLQWYESTLGRVRLVPAAVRKVVGRAIDPLRTWRWMRSVDLVVIPGAGVFETTTPVRPWAQPLSLLTVSVAGRISRTPVAYLCVGANVPGQRLIRWQHRWAARLADYRSYRDDYSRHSMRAVGVDVSRDPVFPDLALGLPTPAASDARRNRVGVGLMNFRGGNDDRGRADQLHERYVDAMTALVSGLVSEGRDVHLFTGDAEDDLVVDRVLAGVSSAAGAGVVRAEPVDSLPSLLDVLARVDTVVASRHHNVMGGLMAGVPTVAVTYAEKTKVLMQEFGVGRYCHPAASVDVRRLRAQLDALEAEQAEVRLALAANAERQRAEVRRQFDEFEQFVTGAMPAVAETTQEASRA